MEKINRVFVYGTLRSGWGLNRYIKESKGEMLGIEELAGFKMFSLGPFPAINHTDDPESYVVGEVYEFPDSTVEHAFRVMDMIELGAGYEREVVDLPCGLCYTYVHTTDWKKRGAPVLNDWTKEGRR